MIDLDRYRRRIGHAGPRAPTRAVLDEVFDLQPPLPAAVLFERVPKGLDGAFAPAGP